MSETAERGFVPARVHGTYLALRPEQPSERAEAAGLLVGFHSYAETAEASLAELARIPGARERWTIAAIQALHPFYTKSGAIVAGWMTSFDRERAIADNRAYVRDAIAALRREFRAHGPLVVAGFSQGVAMAYRAAAALEEPVAGIVALAGDLPPELVEAGGSVLPGRPPVLIGRGDRENWYTPEKLAADRAALERGGSPVQGVEFAGGHEWTEDFRTEVGRFLAARLHEASVERPLRGG